jgi:hypothetical protein
MISTAAVPQKGTNQMSDVTVCLFCSREAEPGRAVCAECPSASTVLAMDIADLQDSVAELFRRLDGKPQSEAEQEEEREEQKTRYERMLRVVEAALAERR